MIKQLCAVTSILFPLALGVFNEIKPSASEADMSFIEMVQFHGYPVWSKLIDTPDGYTLNLFRIPGPRGESLSSALRARNREPLLLLHGVLSSSECFVMNGPGVSPAYQLADSGRYDLWLLNVRGNAYSKKHNFMDAASDRDYWNFGFEEMGDLDLPAAVDFVLQATGRAKLTLLGFSQGTTIAFYSLVNNKARL